MHWPWKLQRARYLWWLGWQGKGAVPAGSISLGYYCCREAAPPYNVNLRIFLFGRYKSRRRPHPAARASWVIQHPPSLTHLTQLDQSARFPSFSTAMEIFLAPSGPASQHGQNGPPDSAPSREQNAQEIYTRTLQSPFPQIFLSPSLS